MAIITPSITAPDHADNSKNQEAVYIIPQTQTELIAHLDMRPVVLPDTLPSPMLETILTPDNLHHYTPNHLVDAYYQGKVEIQCVDGRSVQRNDKLVIHTPGGEIALYGQLLKTLDELTHDTQVMERLWNKFLMRPLGTTPRGEGVYAHSDTHGTPVSEAHDSAHDDHHHKVYAYGVGNNHADFQCGCGHCNLIMKNDVY